MKQPLSGTAIWLKNHTIKQPLSDSNTQENNHLLKQPPNETNMLKQPLYAETTKLNKNVE